MSLEYNSTTDHGDVAKMNQIPSFYTALLLGSSERSTKPGLP